MFSAEISKVPSLSASSPRSHSIVTSQIAFGKVPPSVLYFSSSARNPVTSSTAADNLRNSSLTSQMCTSCFFRLISPAWPHAGPNRPPPRPPESPQRPRRRTAPLCCHPPAPHALGANPSNLHSTRFGFEGPASWHPGPDAVPSDTSHPRPAPTGCPRPGVLDVAPPTHPRPLGVPGTPFRGFGFIPALDIPPPHGVTALLANHPRRTT